MKISIEYESSWRNSFLEGNNNEPLPKEGRKFIGSMTSLKSEDNYIERDITIDTVMGILNRLIGDQRKLYQARQDELYFFKDIEDKVRFKDVPIVVNNEITYIRNVSGSTDQNSYTGMIRVSDPVFNSAYSQELWSVLALSLEDLCIWLVADGALDRAIDLHPLVIIERLEQLNKLKVVPLEGIFQESYEKLAGRFPKFKGLNKKGELFPISLYCSALYLQLDCLRERGVDVSSALTKAGGLSGISNNGFTKKDFMSRYTTGDKKKIWGNPYMREEFVAGQGKSKKLLKKVSGQLQIDIDIDRPSADKLYSMIDNAGVSSFYLGKKGLAYVTDIRV
ncbi:hypothetical protein HCU74_17825 [Spongiibacter sp. KMU-166]|uniref:Cas5fv helical domain-containing protein n=1 Tax=Spongiibacter thalassae TaxID=2721624 RepID=A0ABX1GJ95_9GAMM|nr:type I-Fv CRISPR-associated protein Cas5fv [Spongiibacter thalassae]NKI19270.1 hypothetical protein [Spongiibacter thalassae]